jgi:hypothetical protein
MAKNKGFKGYKSDKQKYAPEKKGSGKPKYKNVIKEARVNTRAEAKESVKSVAKITGKKLTKKDISRKAEKRPNIAKQIDREEKIRKGVRTEKSTTKTPVKRSTVRAGFGRGGAGIGGMFGVKNR